jgi:uncharacterized protein (TIGR03435 family)
MRRFSSHGRRRKTLMVIALFLAGPMATMAWAQPVTQVSRPTFEAASVRPNKNCPGPQTRILPGRLAVNCASLLDLITFAYGVRTDQVAEGPSWISYDRYDIEATAAGNTSGAQIAGTMFQALLEDRFKLTLHREMRQLPVYALAVAKSGLKLRPSQDGSCTAFSPDSPPVRPATGMARLPFCGYPRTGRNGLTWNMDGEGITMGALAENLSRLQLGRGVIDATGLAGSYGVHLKWTGDPLAAGTLDNASSPPASDDGLQPSLFTALRELGLRMEASNGPVEVLAIDHVERPSKN